MDGMDVARGGALLNRMVGVRFEPQEYDALAAAAIQEHRTVSSLVRMAAMEWLKVGSPPPAAPDGPALTKTRMVGVRFAQDEHDALSTAATADHRKLASLIRIVMLTWLSDRTARERAA